MTHSSSALQRTQVTCEECPLKALQAAALEPGEAAACDLGGAFLLRRATQSDAGREEEGGSGESGEEEDEGEEERRKGIGMGTCLDLARPWWDLLRCKDSGRD